MSAEARRLVLLRHGRTSWNLSRRIQGQLDPELDDTGHAQAAAVAPRLAGLRPAALWSSDLARARQTAAYVAKEAGLDPTYDPRLREYFLGTRQGLTHEEYAATCPEEFAGFRQGLFDVVPDGEAGAQVVTRMAEALLELLSTVPRGATAVAVSHGAAIRDTVPVLVGWDASGGRPGLRGMDNCGWAELVQVERSAPLQLVAYNRVEPTGTPDFASPEESG